MAELRQQLLVLHLAGPDLASGTVAWALYDGAADAESRMQTADEESPPYGSVLEAMRNGWRVLQMSSPPPAPVRHETGQLPYEFVLERLVNVDGKS